jgi:O-antigen/teichoic acid export membrane protein
VSSFAKSLGSYWFYYLAQVVAAFVVAPIVVARLGAEDYGIWTALLSAGGYLAVLDLGIHAALVRQIALHSARGDDDAARRTFSTAFTLLLGSGAVVFCALFGASSSLVDFLGVSAAKRDQALLACRIVAIEIGVGMVGASFLGVLAGLRSFVRVNLATVVLVVVRSAVLVVMLERGAGLITVALVQLAATLAKHALQFAILRRERSDVRWRPTAWSGSTARALLSYGAYSVLIVFAVKILLYTDALVIARCMSPADVTYYAVPASIFEHVERLALAAVAIMVPWISANEAQANVSSNRRIFVVGTRYALLALLPVMFALYAIGGDFLRLWMGAEFERRGAGVLALLAAAQFFALPQFIAHGILKGGGRVRFLALALVAQAAANLALSLWWVRDYGLLGIAAGTAVPLSALSLIVLPLYMCRLLAVPVGEYFRHTYPLPLALAAGLIALDRFFPCEPANYTQLVIYGVVASAIVAVIALRFGCEPEHRSALATRFTALLTRRSR